MDSNNTSVNNDYFVSDTIEDSISQLKFCPNLQSNVLASCGWDSKVRLWSITYQLINQQQNSANQQPAMITSALNCTIPMDNPLLSLCWQGETPNLFTGASDGTISLIDVQKMQKNVLGKHDLGCKEVLFVPKLNVLISGGWDGKVNIWDLRSNSPAVTYRFNQKVYSMSCNGALLVVALSDRIVSYFNLAKLQNQQFLPEATFESHLKYQTRKVSCFIEGDGYAIGSIEGRVAIKYVNLNAAPEISNDTKTMTTKNDFAFRCHRSLSAIPEVFPVNDIAFNQKYGTFATVGGDGSYIMWDKDSRSRLKQGQLPNKCPITACDYSFNGDLFAYAAGYDWAKGIGGDGQFVPKLGIHYCLDQDKFKKQKK